MKKTRNKKWRHVYPYTCTGCGRKRIAFDHTRAAGGMCTLCEVKVDPNQTALPLGQADSPTQASLPPETPKEVGQA